MARKKQAVQLVKEHPAAEELVTVEEDQTVDVISIAEPINIEELPIEVTVIATAKKSNLVAGREYKVHRNIAVMFVNRGIAEIKA